MFKKYTYRILTITLFIIFFLSICSANESLKTKSEIYKEVKPGVMIILDFSSQESFIQGNFEVFGTGFFISKNGYMITNSHVLDNYQYFVIMNDNFETYNVKRILMNDIKNDIAVLEVDIPPDKTHPLIFSMLTPEVGQDILAIGTPEGMMYTMSTGIISGLRSIPDYADYIQFDAAISPGSSGGPLLNMKGEVIGIVKSYLNDQAAQNINFAIPSYKIFEILKSYGISIASSSMAHAVTQETQKIDINVSPTPPKKTAEDYYNSALFYINQGRYEEAIEACKQAILLNSDYAEAYIELSYSLNKLGRFQQTIDFLEDKIKPKVDYCFAYSNLGEAYFNLKQYKNAVNSLNQAIQLKNDIAIAHYYLGMSYLFINDFNLALTEYESLKLLDRNLGNELLVKINEFLPKIETEPTSTKKPEGTTEPTNKPFPQVVTNEEKIMIDMSWKNKGDMPFGGMVNFNAVECEEKI